jgi:LmbE family N-acetylglucosaminyl deacetylase
MNPYQELVAAYSRSFRHGKALPHGGFASVAPAPSAPNAPRALIFSPHPDDEGIIGGLPLRLLRESGWAVLNVAVTQGSNRARQQERFEELRAACHYIGYGLIQTSPSGLEKINPKTRLTDPDLWRTMVSVTARILATHRPQAIFFPHVEDWNSTHIGTHWLVMDALVSLGSDFGTYLVETEYWGQMTAPNLMVESLDEDVSDLVTEVSFHAGEVRRNPFHLLLPAWMQDNVRRGSELVGGQGQAAPDFGFATLYRMRLWKDGGVHEVLSAGRTLGAGESPSRLFEAA